MMTIFKAECVVSALFCTVASSALLHGSLYRNTVIHISDHDAETQSTHVVFTLYFLTSRFGSCNIDNR